EVAELLDRGLPEDRRGVADEVDPELARHLLGFGRRSEPHPPLLEALRLEAPRERLLDDEQDPVPALPEDLADPNAVVRRPVSTLGEEDDGRHQCRRLSAAATIARCPSPLSPEPAAGSTGTPSPSSSASSIRPRREMRYEPPAR